MEIGKFIVIKQKDGNFVSNINSSLTKEIETDSDRIEKVSYLYSNLIKEPVGNRENLIDSVAIFSEIINALLEGGEAGNTEEVSKSPEEILKKGLENLIDFFTEFSFEPNYRFVNTLTRSLGNSKKEAKEYIQNYFELINSPYAPSVTEKMKSKEFTKILEDLKVIKPSRNVNDRFKIYYGSQGTGKTTIAMKEASGKCIVCHSAMLPSDLMEDFKFNEGKAEFIPSELYRAIVEGRPIVLDEINLLPFESLRFLQGIVDGKEEFIYKGNTVKIADGFKIIGTMNLTVNGMTYGLPEPLVDRCETTRKFRLSADTLMGAII